MSKKYTKYSNKVGNRSPPARFSTALSPTQLSFVGLNPTVEK